MSKLASWTYKFKATVWPFIAGDGWEVDDSYGEPVVIMCDYKGESKAFTNSIGTELTSSMVYSTEYGQANENDLVLLGIHTGIPPREAKVILAIQRTSDIFKSTGAKQADDFKLIT